MIVASMHVSALLLVLPCWTHIPCLGEVSLTSEIQS
jgi:hypothetical protein